MVATDAIGNIAVNSTPDIEEIISDVKDCILKYKINNMAPCLNRAIEAGIAPEILLNKGMIAAMDEIGEGFKQNMVFMPQMLIAAKTMQIGLKILEPFLKSSDSCSPRGKAIVGSVMGDVHDIGKNLVTVMLQGAGFSVKDLGADVPPEKFIEEMDRDPAVSVVACSSSMTPTRESLKETVDLLNARPDRANFGIFVGGATMDQSFCDKIGADVYTEDAASAAKRASEYASGLSIKTVGEKAREEALRKVAKAQETRAQESAEPASRRHLEPPMILKLKAEGRYDREKLSIWDNLQEWLKHDEGCPDAFLNQYFFDVLFDPVMMNSRNLVDEFVDPKPVYMDGWGVTHSIPKGSAGSHPEEGEDVLVIKDITKWKEQVKGQPMTSGFPEEAWDLAKQQMKAAEDAGRPYAIPMFPGLFERTHFLMGMKQALTAFYEHPEEMHELIDWVVDWECRSLDEVMAHTHAPILFHHDDWGTAINSFLDPATHREFFLEPYKKIYQHFRDLGGKVVIHHSDSYAANLVEIDIEAGVDIWQGPVSSNNIDELIDKYGDRFLFMGGIDNAEIDLPDWTEEGVEEFVRQRIERNGCRSYIPCLTRGLGFSIVPGVYDAVTRAIDKISKEKF
ncbi:MAG: cobalamin-dependent protein [Candidatus Methanomethylophilaceae archaeon]|nr:cobalamin-dependent protein [Candidatus Methanomethylophilaceae archaeon]